MRKIYPSAAGPVEAVRNLTFDVRRGELACIVGPSGAGKTTLLKIISGLLEPTEGEVVLDGKKVTGYSSITIGKVTARLPASGG